MILLNPLKFGHFIKKNDPKYSSHSLSIVFHLIMNSLISHPNQSLITCPLDWNNFLKNPTSTSLVISGQWKQPILDPIPNGIIHLEFAPWFNPDIFQLVPVDYDFPFPQLPSTLQSLKIVKMKHYSHPLNHLPPSLKSLWIDIQQWTNPSWTVNGCSHLTELTISTFGSSPTDKLLEQFPQLEKLRWNVTSVSKLSLSKQLKQLNYIYWKQNHFFQYSIDKDIFQQLQNYRKISNSHDFSELSSYQVTFYD